MAFLQSDPPRQPVFQAPAVVLWLIGALAAAHGVKNLASDARMYGLVREYALIPARYSQAYLESRMGDPGTIWERLVPFVSYMALHSDVTHLVINCLWLLAFGPIVARRFGAALFLIFFLLCGIAAAAFYMVLNWGSDVPVVGASGAISGLMGAAIRMMPGRIAPWMVGANEVPLQPLLSRPILIFSAAYAAINLLLAVIELGPGSSSGQVAWQAHLGGYAAGLLLSGVFDRLRPRSVEIPLEN
jgi:membrane associated rhomboid family serine protease